MRGTREEDRGEFKILINVCEMSIRNLEKHWHRQMTPILKGAEYEEIKMWTKDALIGLRSDIMSLENQLNTLDELERGGRSE